MKRLVALFLALSMALALAACGGGNSKAPTETTPATNAPATSAPSEPSNPTGDTTVTIGYAAKHQCIHPSSTVSNDYIASMMIYDLLFELDDVTGEKVSRTLSDWGWEDPVTFRMDLKEGITFADGTEVTPDDVLYTLYSYVAPGGRTDKFQHYKYIDFEKSYVDGQSVYVVWTQEYSPAEASLIGCPIMSKAFTEANDESSEIWFTNPLGSGPYKVKECVMDSYVTFELRDDYWAADQYHYDCSEITIRYYTDETAMYVDYQNGVVDVIYNISSNIAEQVTANNDGTVNYIPNNDVALLMINSKRNPALGDTVVREAIAHAIDMDAIAQMAFGVLYQPATSHMASSFDAYTAHDRYTYDYEYARKLLEDAGYKDGDIVIDFIAANVGAQPQIAEAVQGYLSMVGIKVNVQTLDLGTALVEFQTGENDLSVMQVTGGNPQKIPMSVFNGMNAGTPMKDKAIPDTAFNELLNEGMYTTDMDVANKAFASVDAWLWDNYHALPIAETMTALAFNSRIVAFPQSAMSRGCLGSIDLAD